jgi:uroporphyrinogen decarboxylase
MELFLDKEVQVHLCKRFGLLTGLQQDDPFFAEQRYMRVLRFLGYDYVPQGIDPFNLPIKMIETADTANLQREGGRSYVDESKGPITNWEEFEKYPWPDPAKFTTRALEWYEKNLPDDMCVIGRCDAHYLEFLLWLMGYQTLCYTLYDDRELVRAIAEQIDEICTTTLHLILEFDRVKIIWGSDDMGFRTGTLISPKDLREFVLPGHKKMTQMTHAVSKPYLLHSCGNIGEIMDELITDIKIDAKHSFEDTIEDVRDVKAQYGCQIALLGGIDVNFLCQANEAVIRQRVRDTLDVCLPGGGYCLGTGNSVANYIPIENYLFMLDEGNNYPTN